METVNWMDKEKAAGMFLVAWVKDWTMVTLVHTLAQRHLENIDEEITKQLHEHYPFMPSNLINYYAPYLKRTKFEYVRRFVANNYPKLSNALWEANDNKEILALKPRVLKLISPDIARASKFSREERNERARENRYLKAGIMGYRMSRNTFTKGRGNNGWKTVK